MSEFSLQHLFPGLATEMTVNGAQIDSRKLSEGDVFVAVASERMDGFQFAQKAQQAGARAIVSNSVEAKTADLEIPVFYRDELLDELGYVAATVNGHPSRQLKLVGVTGTNGKTSTCQFVASIHDQLGQLATPAYRGGYIGTNGQGLWGDLVTIENTTPDVFSLNQMLKGQLDEGAKVTAIEVSSHGIHQQRIQQLNFDVVMFTNLSRDHLDYHPTMEAYGQVKKQLFTDYSHKTAVINTDDEFGRTLARELLASSASIGQVLTLSVQDSNADIYAEGLDLNDQGMNFIWHSPWGVGEISAQVYGEFNCANLLAAASACCATGGRFEDVCGAIENLKPVAGRMEFIPWSTQGAGVVVDYSHTPDSLAKALQACRHHVNGDLWVVFGCGGDRDPGKRPLMAQAAEQFGDRVVVTDDNPRFEESEAIIAETVKGFKKPERVEAIGDRKAAIEFALAHAQPQDLVLIAGKGHEDYQEIRGVKHHFSDQEVVRNFGHSPQLETGVTHD